MGLYKAAKVLKPSFFIDRKLIAKMRSSNRMNKNPMMGLSERQINFSAKPSAVNDES